MITNKRPSAGRPFYHGSDPGEKAAVKEETIRTEKIQIERKTFVFALKENPRGRFLRITEDVGGRRDTIIIPAPGLEEFRRVVDEMIQIPPSEPESAPAE